MKQKKQISKKWIYIPLYVGVLICTVMAFSNFLNREEQAELVEVQSDSDSETVPKAFLACFDKHQNEMQGIFKITPSSKLESAFQKLNFDCYNDICSDLQDIRSGEKPYAAVFGKSLARNECFNILYEDALSYHNKQLSDRLVLGLFYDSGESEMSSAQRDQLEFFLKKYRKIADEWGLLIIGRASNDGSSRTNNKLSKDRAKNLRIFIDDIMDGNLRTDYIYFGSEAPQLTLDLAYEYGIDREDFKQVKINGARDRDFSLRLNQSALLVLYPLKENPFGLQTN